MGFLQKFEGKMEDTVEGMASSLGGSSLSPVQITKKAEKQMRREKIVGAGVQYAPTLYTVLVSPEDDARLFGYYPTLAGEVETYLMAKANEMGLDMDGQPLVRFLADPELKRGKFDVVAEMVAAPIVARLRNEELQRYGLAAPAAGPRAAMGRQPQMAPMPRSAQQQPMRGMGYPGAMGGAMGAGAPSPVAGAVVPTPEPMGSAMGAPAARSGRPSVKQARGYVPPVVDDGYDDAFDDGYYADYADGGADGFDDMDGYADEPRTTVMNAVPATAAAPASTDGLEVYLYDEQRDRAYQLTGRAEHIGRESANDIVVPDINVSRVHAEIRCEPNGTWVITDLGSTNGVYVNGRQVKTAPLRDADMITLGTSELEFQLLS